MEISWDPAGHRRPMTVFVLTIALPPRDSLHGVLRRVMAVGVIHSSDRSEAPTAPAQGILAGQRAFCLGGD